MAKPAQPKRLFVAATKQDQGKTTVSLGLMAAFRELCGPVSFIKPVGQRYVEIDGVRVDEDVALMRAVFASHCELADMNPITVGRGFTRQFILKPDPEGLRRKILDSFARVSAGMGSVVIEGTGHAGVGSCFDTSNADVAQLLGAKAVLVTSGGIGRPIDEVLLNQSLFRDRGVELMGVVLNKVLPDKLESIRQTVRIGLERKGIDLLGCVPHEPLLSNPTMQQVLDEVGGELLNGQPPLTQVVESVVVGAMTAHRALEYIHPGCLLITPGDRDDLILAATSPFSDRGDQRQSVAGILLTGGVAPHKNILEVVRRTVIPVVLVSEDSYAAATTVKALQVKIQPTDREKIRVARRLVRKYVAVPRIFERM